MKFNKSCAFGNVRPCHYYMRTMFFGVAVLTGTLCQMGLCAKTFREKCDSVAGSLYYKGHCYLAVPIFAGNADFPDLATMIANQERLCTHMTGYMSGWAVIPDRTTAGALLAWGLGKYNRYSIYRLDWPARTSTWLTWHWMQSDGRKWPQVHDARLVADGWDGNGRNSVLYSHDRMGDVDDRVAGNYVCQYRGPLSAAVKAAGALGVESGDMAHFALEQHDAMRTVGGCVNMCYGILLCQAFSYSQLLSTCRLHRIVAGDAHILLTLVANASFAYYELQAAHV